MSRPYNYSVFSFPVPSDVSQRLLEYYGQKLILLDADRHVTFYLDNNTNDGIPIEKGQVIRLDTGFEKIYWSAKAGTDIVFQISAPGDLSIEGNNVNVNLSGAINRALSASITTTTLTASAAIIAASNTDRKSILVKNVGTVDACIGFSNAITAVPSNDAFKLAAGESIGFENYTGVIYGIGNTAVLKIVSEG